MSVYVVLAFENEEQAKKFVHTSLYGTVAGIPRDNSHDDPEDYPDASVYAIYKKPTQYCDCISASKRDGGYSRGLKYGWWIHAACSKPTKGWAHGDSWFTELGTNLLPSQLHPEGAQFTNQPRSEAEWTFLLPERQDA